jgi:hypothetical protein
MDVADSMLNQWSKNILEAWIGVYASLLPILSKKEPENQDKLVAAGVALARKMSKLSEPIQVRASAALLIGELAAGNSLLSVDKFESNFLATIKNICQDFNWEVRKKMTDQLLSISQYIGAQKSFEHLFPELVELFDDEEKDVTLSAIGAFADLIIDVYSKDEALIKSEKLVQSFKILLSNPHLLQREDFNRLILEVAPQVALTINRP